MRKQRMLMIFFVVLPMLLCCAAGAWAESISGCGITVESDAEMIDFDNVKVKDFDELCQLLDQLPHLKQVDMYRTSIASQNIEMLAERYPEMIWGWTMRVGDHSVRTDVTAFSTLHSVSPNSLHTQKQFQLLRYCHHLQALDFGHNNVTDLSFLYDLPELKILIAACQKNIGSLEAIGSLHDLVYLELFNTHLTDVTPLAGLEHLEDLNICNNGELRDISALYAEGALPSLKRFWCSNTRVPDEQKQAMEAAHPDCIFDWVNPATKNGWRYNTRYDALMKIFKSGVYEPLPDPVWDKGKEPKKTPYHY